MAEKDRSLQSWLIFAYLKANVPELNLESPDNLPEILERDLPDVKRARIFADNIQESLNKFDLWYVDVKWGVRRNFTMRGELQKLLNGQKAADMQFVRDGVLHICQYLRAEAAKDDPVQDLFVDAGKDLAAFELLFRSPELRSRLGIY